MVLLRMILNNKFVSVYETRASISITKNQFFRRTSIKKEEEKKEKKLL